MLEVAVASNEHLTKYESKSNQRNASGRDFYQLVNGKKESKVLSGSTKVHSESSAELLMLNSSQNGRLSNEGEYQEWLEAQSHHFKDNLNSSFEHFHSDRILANGSLVNSNLTQLYPYTLVATGSLEYISTIEANTQLFTATGNVVIKFQENLSTYYKGNQSTNSENVSSVAPLKSVFNGIGFRDFGHLSKPAQKTSNQLSSYQMANSPTLQSFNSISFKKLTYIRLVDGNVKVVLRDYRIDQEQMSEWYHEIESSLKPHTGYVLNGVSHPTISKGKSS
ncbi:MULTISPECIES: hypothetical protein [unclassified Agarivorans]|uniref:hypothetical protein n=1 Tax=unclassified Agarivorans TaxID=2636026 RepID=UPI0026E162DC|nr:MULTISPECIES: hypothetical protein [unclassified Agarivorans]MDO6685858.1 hypothetical protein [Agarivorans sp. 3_MG-2023]MDO6716027.1 hypothetical protein [Agarivorans sp. 2_MG-2023]